MKMKEDENPKKPFSLIFNSVQCCEVLLVFSCQPRNLFFPSCLSFMAVIGTSCEKEEFLGFSRKWVLASIFPAQHEKAHITKDLHICQRFGAERKGEGKKRQEKGALLHFKSSNSKLGFFGINSWSSSYRADESWQLSIDGLFSGRPADIT